VNTLGHRFGNPQCAIHASARALVMEDDHPGLVNEELPDEVVAHAQEVGELVHAEVLLEGSLTSCHAVTSRAIRGKTRDKANRENCWKNCDVPRRKGQF
jgi:hypothetical protein